MSMKEGSRWSGGSDRSHRASGRRLPWLRLGLLTVLVAGTSIALRSPDRSVETALVRRDVLNEVRRSEGEFRVRERFVLSAPFDGKLLRSELMEGDQVSAGATVVARLTPHLPTPLDRRSRAEAEAAVERGLAQVGLAQSETQRAVAQQRFARAELQRRSRLVHSGILPASERENALLHVEIAEESLRAAHFAEQTARSELRRARVRLQQGDAEPPEREVFDIRSPIDGVVLSVRQRNESVVRAGEPLIEVGDPRDLEIVTEMTTRDAVHVTPGQPARILDWGGAPLAARVRRVEPRAITRVTALGIEEQRVAVHLDVVDFAPGRQLTPADGYRVEVEIEIWSSARTLVVPQASLFRGEDTLASDDWRVFTVDDRGELTLRRVTIGRHGTGLGRGAQLIAGLTEGERVVLFPDLTLEAGQRVHIEG